MAGEAPPLYLAPGVAKRGREQVVEIVVGALTPLVGATMARSSTQGLCAKHGLSGPALDARQLDALVAALEPGLNVFVGRDRARAVLASIRRAVDGLPEGA